jgi:hypothetical protein
VVDYTPIGEASEDGGVTTDYDSDEDFWIEGGDNKATFSNFVEAAGYKEPLDEPTKTTLTKYWKAYQFDLHKTAGIQQTNFKLSRNTVLRTILELLKHQSKDTQIWSARKLSREMNEGLQYHKRTDLMWKFNGVETNNKNLAKSWNNNIQWAKRNLKAAKKK